MSRWSLSLACVVILLSGCSGKETVRLDVESKAPAVTGGTNDSDREGLRVAVRLFEDGREETNGLGSRVSFWGGESVYQLKDGSPGEVVAHEMVDFLNSRGWQAELIQQDQAVPQVDVVMSGTIRDLSVDAVGAFGYTQIVATSKITVEALNLTDKSRVRMTLRGSGSNEVFWFEFKDAEELASAVVTASYERLLTDTKIENNLLRLK